MDDKIRIYVGTEEKTEIFRIVLEHSIKTRTKADVIVTPMIGSGWVIPPDMPAGTGFSLRRWIIASKQGTGRAIYMDADQLVLGDVRELWSFPDTMPKENCTTWCTYQPDKFSKSPWPQSSVMVIDCDAAAGQWGWQEQRMYDYLRGKDRGSKEYVNFMHATWQSPPPVKIPVEWNHLNVLNKNTKLLHYTKEPEQPHTNPSHRHADIWRQELVATIKAGLIPKKLFEEQLAKWGVREDWRKTNGLHPIYKKYLPLFG